MLVRTSIEGLLELLSGSVQPLQLLSHQESFLILLSWQLCSRDSLPILMLVRASRKTSFPLVSWYPSRFLHPHSVGPSDMHCELTM